MVNNSQFTGNMGTIFSFTQETSLLHFVRHCLVANTEFRLYEKYSQHPMIRTDPISDYRRSTVTAQFGHLLEHRGAAVKHGHVKGSEAQRGAAFPSNREFSSVQSRLQLPQIAFPHGLVYPLYLRLRETYYNKYRV